MANTLGGINLAQIAQETLKALLLESLPVRAFTKDFNADIAQKGESVTTRVPSAVTAQDLSTGYTPTDVTSAAKVITLSNFKGFVFGFTDAEVSKAGNKDFLKMVFIDPAIRAVQESVMDALLALITAANYANSTVITAAAFDADSLATLAGSLSTANVQKNGRYAILKPTYFASLVKDNAIQSSFAYGGSEAVRENMAPRVHGFEILEYNDIPANGEALESFVGVPEGLLIAARQPAVPQYFTGEIENVQDPVTGLPMQFRAWYDHEAGKCNVSIGILFGVAVGTGGSIHRIKSA